MNLRHAAALALVGWYLLCPPRVGPGLGVKGFNTQAPLEQWLFVGSDRAFATSTECEQEHQKISRYFLMAGGQSGIDDFERGLLVQASMRIDAAQCISSDDLRLAK
jgi:hypothetical protein